MAQTKKKWTKRDSVSKTGPGPAKIDAGRAQAAGDVHKDRLISGVHTATTNPLIGARASAGYRTKKIRASGLNDVKKPILPASSSLTPSRADRRYSAKAVRKMGG